MPPENLPGTNALANIAAAPLEKNIQHWLFQRQGGQ
jgi:hypothetical protein